MEHIEFLSFEVFWLVNGLVEDDWLLDLSDSSPFLSRFLFFPRPATYRLWVQFQRRGVVNTVAYTVPVRAL